MFNVGRVCVKLAGRDAGKRCVVVEALEDASVVVDGETRRRKVNMRHLEPLEQTIDLAPGASHEEVAALLNKQGWSVRATKPKQRTQRPLHKRKAKAPKAKPAKTQETVRPAAATKAAAITVPPKELPGSAAPAPREGAASSSAKPISPKKEKEAKALP